jgi:hypothetical protein
MNDDQDTKEGPPTRSEYYVRLSAYWLYVLLWLAGLGAYLYWFLELPLIYKILLQVVIIIIAPTGIVRAFDSYDAFITKQRNDQD